MPSLVTFNANNFFLRYEFTQTYPGDMSQASLIEAGEVGLLGYIPGLAFGQYSSRYIVWDAQRRELAARALWEPDGCFHSTMEATVKSLANRLLRTSEYNSIATLETRCGEIMEMFNSALSEIKSPEIEVISK